VSAATASRKRKRLFGKNTWLAVLGSLVVAVQVVGSADAHWTAGGTGSGGGPVGTLAATTISSATPGAGTATLTWTAVTPPGSGSVSYYVQRNGGDPAGNCPTQAAPTSVLTCTDSGLSKGAYTYAVTVVWHSWTATSSPAQVTLSSGALDHFVLSAATTTPTAGAADNLTITAVDAAGNTVTGYSGSHNLTFSGAGTIGSLSPTVTNSSGTAINFGTATAITFTNGVAAVSTGPNGAMTLYKAETITVSVTDTSISGTSASITISAAAANKLSFTQSPSNTVAGVAFASQPVVTVQDQYGNTVTTDTSSVTIAVTGGTATLSGCAANPKAASAGVATFGGCTITTAGTYTLTATDGSLTSAVSGSFTISAAAANKLSFTQSPSNTVAGVAFASQPKVTVQDQYGNTVTGDSSTVTLAIKSGTPTSGGPGSLTGCSQSESNGVVTFVGCKITTVGTAYQLHATDGSLTAADSTAFNITPGAANKLSFTQSPSNTVAGVAFASQPVVTVQDQYGNTVTTDTSSVTIAVTGGTATLSGCAANPKAASAGVATFGGCTITTAGTYTLTATDGSLTSAVSGSFTISAAAANKLSFTTQPGGGTSNTAWTTQPTVTVQDAYGNTVTSSNASIIVAIGTNPGTGTLSGTMTVAAVNGVATFSNLSIDHVATGYTLTAASSGLTGATSNSFTITAGAASRLSFTTQPGGGTSNTAWTTQPTVTVQDAYGNTVTTATTQITLAITTPAGANLTCTANPQNAAAGIDVFAGCRIDKAGTYTLTATATGLASATSNSFTITAGAANKLAFTTQPTNKVAGFAITPAVTVTVQDAYGNTVTSSNASITVAIGTNPGGGTLSGTKTVAAVNGVATFSTLSIDKAGTGYTLTAASSGLAGATSGTFNISAATLLSQGKSVICSSLESASYPCANAVDGNTTTTRWSSAFSDPQWIYVDLGQSYNITKVVLYWETAYGSSFEIDTSPDATTWTSIYSTTTGTGGTQTLNITGTGRYVRMYGTVRHTQYGYSLYEFQVYGG
jgi:hypothetical protein